MGSDVTVKEEELPYQYSFKVHRSMCSKLMKLVDTIGSIIPEIEATRPRCSSGLNALCLLNKSIDRAKQLLQNCCESSKLWLVISGDAIVSKFQHSRNLLEQSLGELQTVVPVVLAAKISRIIDDLRAIAFTLDSSENEAGKAIRNLLQQGSISKSDSLEHLEIRTLQLAASKLHITTAKSVVIEKRSLRKLLEKVSDNDRNKKKILTYLLYMLKKYGNTSITEHTEDSTGIHEGHFPVVNLSNSSIYDQDVKGESNTGHKGWGNQTNLLSRATPPGEFRCPISMRMMYDPVVIASGQTFERMWIQKWFDEGNNTCPKTKVMLDHCSLTPNTNMKDLISKWCSEVGVTITDPSLQAYQPIDTSSISIASLSSSMNDLKLPRDISSVSVGSLDSSYNSDTPRTKFSEVSRLTVMWENNYSHQFATAIISDDGDLDKLSTIAECEWDLQCKIVEDLKCRMQLDDQACQSFSCEKYIRPLLKFLSNAHSQNDVNAQKAGCQLLLALVNKNGCSTLCLHEDMFSILASFLDSEVTEEVLSIFEVLSSRQNCKSKITASGSFVSILNILDTNSRNLQEIVIRTLQNLSSNSDSCSQIVLFGGVQKLVPLINDSDLSRHCIILLETLCGIEEGRNAVAETDRCIASVSELLESESQEDQEHAMAVLLSLCSQRIQYCHLVMDEGVIPSLVYISKNGSDKGKASALELLRQLRDVEYEKERAYTETAADPHIDAADIEPKEKKPSAKRSGFLRRMMIFRPASKN